eukprot:snap_masked-scaffold_5-processed-gene-9.27-mRNA-1 protein AED:1.00 eAED:1.00 QI:0/0/0/0/1/1/2/0/63
MVHAESFRLKQFWGKYKTATSYNIFVAAVLSKEIMAEKLDERYGIMKYLKCNFDSCRLANEKM